MPWTIHRYFKHLYCEHSGHANVHILKNYRNNFSENYFVSGHVLYTFMLVIKKIKEILKEFIHVLGVLAHC